MNCDPLTALSPLDGRYAGKVDALRAHFSESGLIRCRLRVEIEWLKALAGEPHFAEIPAFSASTAAELDGLVASFGPQQAAEVKAIEAVTNHDVKALEYWIKERTKANAEVVKVSEFIHFACTSEDINNLSHALMCQGAREQAMLPMLDRLVSALSARTPVSKLWRTGLRSSAPVRTPPAGQCTRVWMGSPPSIGRPSPTTLTACRSMRKTACTARLATLKTQHKTSCGSRPKVAADPTTRACSAGMRNRCDTLAAVRREPG